MSESAHTSQTPLLGDVNNGAAITTGGTFTVAVDGTVSAVRFWVPSTNTGTYTVKLYEVDTDDDPAGSGTGTELASATAAAASVTPDQFNNVAITPVSVVTTNAYRATVHASSGRIVASATAFAAGGITNGNVTAIQSGADPVGIGSLLNGTFNEGASPAYPSSSFNATDYFLDIVFDAGGTVASAGRGQVGVVSRVVSVKQAPGVGRTATGIGGRAAGRKAAVGLARLSLGALVRAAGNKIAAAVGSLRSGVGGRAASRKVVASAGRLVIGVGGRAVEPASAATAAVTYRRGADTVNYRRPDILVFRRD